MNFARALPGLSAIFCCSKNEAEENETTALQHASVAGGSGTSSSSKGDASRQSQKSPVVGSKALDPTIIGYKIL